MNQAYEKNNVFRQISFGFVTGFVGEPKIIGAKDIEVLLTLVIKIIYGL